MATGDILSAVVRADGWSMDVTIEGFTTGATYDFGSLDDTPATVTAPMFSVAVVSEGYSAAGVLGTIARTVYGTHVVRKPYPDQASKDETVSGSDLVVRVALSESIYNDDKNGGAGTSGTNPAVTISAAWATNTGGAAQTSAVATALACTNNSTLDYPKVIAQWAWGHTPAFRRVAAAFDIGCIAYHGHGIACVALSATDAHAAAVSGTVTSKTDHAMSASGLHYESYDLAVPVTSFTEGDDITLKFIAYPLVGDADSIIDTSTQTAATHAITGLAQITCTYKTVGVVTKYVGTGGTDDATAGRGDTAGDPYLTIGYALSKSPDIILITDGYSADILGSSPASVTAKNYWIEVKPNTGATVTLTRIAYRTYKAKRLAFVGIQTISVNGGAYFFDGESGDRMLKFENCGFTNTAVPDVSIAYRSYGVWYINNTGMGGDLYNDYSNERLATAFAGNSFSKAGSVTTHYSFVANKWLVTTGEISTTEKIDANAAPTPDNTIIANNEFLGSTYSSAPVIRKLKNDANITYGLNGLAIVGNVIENKAGTGDVMHIGADDSVRDLRNLVIAHNTLAGERVNYCYNDAGIAVNVRQNVFCRNNVFNGFAIKTDTFGTPNANRIGNWAQVNGVNCSDNRYTYQAGLSSFQPDYYGVNVAVEDTGAAIPNEMGFTDDNSAYGDATGNGDYMPTEASVLYDHTLRQAYQSYDLYGAAL